MWSTPSLSDRPDASTTFEVALVSRGRRAGSLRGQLRAQWAVEMPSDARGSVGGGDAEGEPAGTGYV